jgi:hypothetical protein
MKPSVFLLAVLLVTGSSAAVGVCEDAMPSGRVSLVCEGVTVYYDQKDEAFARKFIEYAEPFDRLRALSKAEAAPTQSSRRENRRNGRLCRALRS